MSSIEERNRVVYTTPDEMREMQRLYRYKQDFEALLSRPFNPERTRAFILAYHDVVELDFEIPEDGCIDCELAVQYSAWKLG